jgi:predicted nuclease of predicted toxin-antitoxin system
MRSLLCDANVPEPIVNALNALKIPVVSVNRIPGTAEDDTKVIEVAKTLDAIIVTLDKDFTTNQPLFAAMVEKGSRVVRIIPPKCSPEQMTEQLARIVIQNYRQWQTLLSTNPGIVSCSEKGNRFRELTSLPWYKHEDPK